MRLALPLILAAFATTSCDNPDSETHQRSIDIHETPVITIRNDIYVEPGTSLFQDGVELKPEHAEVFRVIDAEVSKELADVPKRIGFVHTFWAKKKQILKERYGIDWRSPSELNPRINFD